MMAVVPLLGGQSLERMNVGVVVVEEVEVVSRVIVCDVGF